MYIYVYLFMNIALILMFYVRLNLILLFMLLELCIFYVNFNFILVSASIDDIYGLIFSIIITSVSGTEMGLGLSFLILYYSGLNSIFFDNLSNIKA